MMCSVNLGGRFRGGRGSFGANLSGQVASMDAKGRFRRRAVRLLPRWPHTPNMGIACRDDVAS